MEFLPTGQWGGVSVALAVHETGATLEFDCAHGTIDTPLRLDSDGRFEAPGTYEDEGGLAHFISIQTEEDFASPLPATLRGQPARYSGRLTETGLELTVWLIEKGYAAGTYTLQAGQIPRLRKCL